MPYKDADYSLFVWHFNFWFNIHNFFIILFYNLSINRTTKERYKMKKTILVLLTIAILTTGILSGVYAADNNRLSYFGYRMPMMYQYNSGDYKSMLDIMRSNGFESMATAMENRDFTAMKAFMYNLTEEQYNQMIDIMRDNGYNGMARMMGSFGRSRMINMHNSMMGSYIR